MDDITVDVDVLTPAEALGEREILRQLDASRDMFGGLVPAALHHAAVSLGLSTRQTRRRLEAFLGGAVAVRQEFTMDADVLSVIAAHNGNLSAAYRDLSAAGHPVPAFTTFWRGFAQRLDSDIAGYIRHGGKGLLKGSPFVLWQPEQRNDLWEIDHCEMPVDVIADGCATAVVKPWITALIDGRTRRVVAWAITADVERRPDADIVCALMVEATMEIKRNGITYGGVPNVVRCDQGAEFLGTKVSALVTSAGIDLQPVYPRSGHLKGKVERWFWTMETEFCTPQNGFTHGLETRSGHQPFRDTDLMTAAELRRRTAGWITTYNGSRPHSSLAGGTPDAAWAADSTPLRFLPATLVRDNMLLSTKQPKVTTKGVSFVGSMWTSEHLHGRIGRRLNVRFPIFHTGFIELYEGNDWLCTARANLTTQQVRELLDKRNRNHNQARDVVKNAKKRRSEANRKVTDDPTAPLPRSAMADPDPLAGDLDALDELIGRQARTLDGDPT